MLLDHDGALTVNNSISTGRVTAGNVYVVNDTTMAGNLAVNGAYSYFTNLATFNGPVVIANTSPTNDTTSGALIVDGGIAMSGNLNTAGQFFVGTGAQTTVLTSAITVERGTSTSGAGVQFTQHALINDTSEGSSDYIAYADNYPGPSNDHGWMDVGFTGSEFDDPAYSITKANDGYIFTGAVDGSGLGGNLVIATDRTGTYGDIVLATGGFYANAEVARFHGNTINNGTFVLKLPTNAAGSVSANTGALQVWGGASFSGNVYNGGAATFNGSQVSNNDFKVKGVNTTNLIWARPNNSYDTVVIGNTLPTSSLVNGAKLYINSTDSMIVPVGTSAQRPSSAGYSDVAGMVRFNTSLNALEFYTGSSWVAPTAPVFTIITDQQFTANGFTPSFTLSQNATTASTIVSINGILQVPSLSYSVSGTTLTFTETPPYGDIIDVRYLTTTTTVAQLSDGTGINTITTATAGATSNIGITFATGVIGNTANQYGIDSNGGIVTMSPNVVIATSGVPTTVDMLYANTYSSAEYTVTATIRGTNIREISKILMTHNGDASGAGNTIISVYSTLNTAGNTLVSWSAGTTGNIAKLIGSTSNNNTVLRIRREYQMI
jgi:hypothetical protein